MAIIIEGTAWGWVFDSLKWLCAAIDWKWVVSTFVAVVIVVWQVNKQFKANRDLQKDTIRDGFHLEIYKDISVLIDVVVEAHISASNNMMMALSGIEEVVVSQSEQPATSFNNLRVQDFSDFDKKLSKAVSSLVSKLEGNEIIHKNLNIFRYALNSAHHDLFEAKTSLYQKNEKLAAIRPLAEDYINACQDIGSYIHDLQIALQNILLGRLFPKNTVPGREPLDPKFKVVGLEPQAHVEALKNYFLYETAWGKANYKTEARVRAELGIPPLEN